MILAWPAVSSTSPLTGKFVNDFRRPLFLYPHASLCSSISKFSFNASLKFCCFKNEVTEKPTEGFSALESDTSWEGISVWSTMGVYMFNLHIPLGFGGLSIVTYILHQPVLDPQTQVLSQLVLQILELIGALFLLNHSIKPQYKMLSFLRGRSTKERNWLSASTLSLSFLIFLVFVTSLVADTVIGAKAVNNPIVKEILSSGDIAKAACILIYCFITPLLEETVYRGFLLTSLASNMNWQHALVISAAIFSTAHFSIENSLQLFIIGCVLGGCYCWTGNLSSSILVHSLYNAFILLITYLS